MTDMALKGTPQVYFQDALDQSYAVHAQGVAYPSVDMKTSLGTASLARARPCTVDLSLHVKFEDWRGNV